jgi:hypothetical protein
VWCRPLALGFGLALRRWLPHHLFVFILGRGFFGTALCTAAVGALSSWLHGVPGRAGRGRRDARPLAGGLGRRLVVRHDRGDLRGLSPAVAGHLHRPAVPAPETRPNQETNHDPTRDCSDAEWQARQDLAACYRIFHLLGWTEMIYNHISLRVPGPERHFLINPFGLHYSEVCASNLLKVDLAGRQGAVGDSPFQVNAAGFHPHATLHGHIEDATA